MLRCSALFPLFRGVPLFWWCSVIPVLFCCSAGVVFRVRNRCGTRYFLIAWRCFNVSLFCQCSIVVPRCSALFPLFWGVPLFQWCSVIPLLFCRSAGVPCSGVPVVFPCSVLPQVFRVPSFRCSWFYSMQN